MPSWLKQRLGRQATVGQQVGSELRSPGQLEVAWPVASGEPAGLVQSEGPRGPFWSRTECFKGSDRHGDWSLESVDQAQTQIFAWLTGDAALAGLDPRQAVYLDTETTGLSGGAGTWVYMVGLGRFLPCGGFELWQGFMRGPEDEPALLSEAARRIAAASSLVSFFGKSFDRHRLEDKMRLCGVDPPFAALPHLDLYHPLRRLFGGSFDDGRLATLEAELCGLERGVDLPGSQAPAAWFDYLAERPHRLEGVFHHNRLDVLSLVTLLGWLGHAGGESGPGGEPLEGPAEARRRGLVRSCAKVRDWEAALHFVEAALVEEPEARDLALARAEVLRRVGQNEAAGEALEALAGAPEDSFTAPVLAAWAKWLEHCGRDRIAALAACRRAREYLELVPPGKARGALVRDLERRTARLELRCAGDQPGTDSPR